MSIKDFYQSEFNSDPYELMREAADVLSDLAHDAGISWHDNVNSVVLVNSTGKDSKFRRYAGRFPTTLPGTKKGSADIFSRVQVEDGLTVPFINFVRKGSDGGVWSGLNFLWEKYKAHREKAGNAIAVSASQERRQAEIHARMLARKAEREEENARNARKQEQAERRAEEDRREFSHDFDNSPREDGTFPYAQRKLISRVFAACDVRRMQVWNRARTAKSETILAVPLTHLDGRYNGQIVSWQRIYADGSKFQTAAVKGLEYPGACHVIGCLRNARRVCVVEGFATGASVFLSGKFDAVIVAVSANNMKPVVEQLVNCYEAVKVWLAPDNDEYSARQGKGNTGLLYALEILRQFPRITCRRPLFTAEEIQAEMSDFNDLHVSQGEGEVLSQLSSKANNFSSANDLDAELMKLALMPRRENNASDNKKFSGQLMRCVDTGMKSCPSGKSPSRLIKIIADKMEAINADPALLENVKSKVKREFAQKCAKAQGFRSFSPRITDPALRPDHITYRRFDTPHVTPEILTHIQSLSGPVIFRAGMGSGKSKFVLRPMMHEATRGISVAHRVSLIGGLWDMMTRDDDNKRGSYDILHYQDPGYQDMAPYASKLTICVNSISKGCWKPIMANHDFFGLDEATQGLRAILSGRAMENPTTVFNKLIDAVARTEENAILVDADASDILVDFCELVLAHREKLGLTGWTQIHVIELPVDVTFRPEPEAQPQKRRVLYTDKDRIVIEMIKAVQAGEKFLMATDSTAFAEQMLLKLREQWPEKRWLYVSQDTKPEPDVVAFTDAPNQKAQLYDGLIYSPAISSGVSIETPHFTRHFGMFCGQVVPSDAIQMLRRDRTATEFLIGFSQLPGCREENADNIRQGVVQAMIETAFLNNEFTDARIDGNEIRLGLADTPYARLKMKVAAMEATARKEFANNLICILFADGYDVEQLAENADFSALGKSIRKDAKEKNWDLTLERHLEVETPDENQRDELLAKRSLSAEEAAQLTRWEIVHELKQEVNEDSLKFLMDGGRKKLSLAELMRMDAMTAARIDREQALISFTYQFTRAGRSEYVNILAISQEQADEQFTRLQPGVKRPKPKAVPLVEAPQRTFAAVHRMALRQFFETCGINPDTGEGETTNPAIKEAMDQLMAPEMRHKYNNVLRFGGFIAAKSKPKQPAAVFKQICEAVGLEAVKRRGARSEGLNYIWSVSERSRNFVSEILTLRAEDGQTFFEQKQPQITPAEGDLDFYTSIYTDLKSGSPLSPALTGLEAIEEAVTDTPVPFSWVRDVLTVTELAQLAAMPLKLIRATLSGLYLAENMGSLATGVYNELKRLQAV